MKINKLINGYGIKELKYDKRGNVLGNAVIYSSNGTFKSSFSKTLDCLSKGVAENEVHNRLSVDRSEKLECEIEIEGIIYRQNDTIENILVYSREIGDTDWTKSPEVNRLVVSKEYQNKISEIKESVGVIKNYYNGIIKDLKLDKIVSQISGVVNFEANKSIYEINKYIELLKNIDEKMVIPEGFDIKKIGQKAYDSLDNQDFIKEAKALVEIVEKEISSNFFSADFSIDNLNSISDSLEANNFLNKNRQILIIKGDTKEYFDTFSSFKEYINSEIRNIVDNNEEAVELKKSLEKKLGKSNAADNIKKQISNVEWMNFYSKGRINIINGYIANNVSKEIVYEHLEEIKKLKIDIATLESIINTNQSNFEKAIEIHKKRFKPPFNIKICNKIDVVLGTEIPEFIFFPNESINCTKNFNDTREILSSGERNAFDIINLIVKYEAKKNSKQIVILDDVVETFDYSNRNAFIEYIQDMSTNNSIVIILTHNYEFFRTLSMRLGKNFKKYSAHNKDGIVTICNIDEFYFSLKGMLCVEDLSNSKGRKNLSYEEYFISTFPFVREVSEFIGESKPLVYLFHYKEDSIEKTVAQVVCDIKNQIKNYTISPTAEKLVENNENYYEFIFKVCDSILTKDVLPYDIYRKIILSIGCRLKVEEYMINSDFSKIVNISNNQTKELLEKEKNNISEKGIDLVNRVLLSSSEFIHLNAFMYEPLIDINPNELITLYKDIKDIGTAFYK